VTIATALLYYYGYVTTYAEFDYFGVDVDLLHYSTADYVLRSSASLFIPVLALLLLAGLGYWLHTGLSSWGYLIDRPRTARVAGTVAATVGAVLLARGIYGVVNGDVSAHEPIGVSPGSLGVGTLLLLYGLHLRRQASPLQPGPVTNQSRQIVAWTVGWCVVILSLFWLVNSFAHAYGNGTAMYIEKGLADRPEVIVHSRSRLFAEDRGVDPYVLCETTIGSKDYPYRYINLRLLAATDKELFLVPVTWTKDNGVVLVLKRDETSLQLMRWPDVYTCPQHPRASQ
jgi:hypothetical protein